MVVPLLGSQLLLSPGSSSEVSEPEGCDIGRLLAQKTDLKQIGRSAMYQILTLNPNMDPASYPRTQQTSSSPYLRQFQPEWVRSFPWLHYSRHTDGAFCRACALFAPSDVKGQKLSYFVTRPFTSWIKMTSKATKHSKQEYHQLAVAKMDEFIRRYKHPPQSVDALLNSAKKQRMLDNQCVIESLLKTIMFCGRQGISLRGHSDDHVSWSEFEERNLGNFIELLKFRAEHDHVLAQHLKYAPRNATYTSKTIQNEMIDVIGTVIRNDIIKEVKSSKLYSVIADEVTDSSNKEQLSLSLRYVTDENVKEMFLDFIEVERITGQALSDAILHWLDINGLPVADMRGQCYDGTSSMSASRAGCQVLIQKEAPKAIYVHCSSHKLNLAIVSACKISTFKNTESYIGEISRFFAYSAKRQRLLDKAIESIESSTGAKKLKDVCRTRWVQRIDSYIVFEELLPAVHTALKAMVNSSAYSEFGSNWAWDGDTTTKAYGFLYQLESSTFLVCFQILLKILYYLREITVKLQMQAVDVLCAYDQISFVVTSLQKMREDSETEFEKIYDNTMKMGKMLHGGQFEIEKPRTTGRQNHRSNPGVDSAKDYYRITLFDEFVSHVVAQLQERFIDNPAHSTTNGLMHLIPQKCVASGGVPKELAEAVEYYSNDLPYPRVFSIEYEVWTRKWQCVDDPKKLPSRLFEVYSDCSPIQFPNIKSLLQIALTVPVTSCECERSFSQLKILKTPSRSTMSEKRLSGLALMKIHRELCMELSNPDRVTELVQKFSEMHPRRMSLSFMLSE